MGKKPVQSKRGAESGTENMTKAAEVAEALKMEDLEARYKRYRGILQSLTIMSDMFMRNVFKKKECVEHVLRVVLGKKDVLGETLENTVKSRHSAIQ